MNNNNLQRPKHLLFLSQLQKAERISNAQPIWLKRTFQWRLTSRSQVLLRDMKPGRMIALGLAVALVADQLVGERYIEHW
jgi:hypothetical protein